MEQTGKLKCPECGFENPPGLKFCGNCGKKLVTTITPSSIPGALVIVLLATSLYLLVSVLLNALVRASPLFWVSYLASGLLGLYAGYEFGRKSASGRFKTASAFAIGIGLASTVVVFVVGLSAQGVIGPVWIFYGLATWLLWKLRKS